MTISTEQFLSVNTGTTANDGTGDSLRAAFVKVNENFDNMSTIGFDSGNINVGGDIEATGNISAVYFVGDGRFITNVTAIADYTNSNVAAYLPTYSGNIADVSITGNATIEGVLTASGNVIVGNVYVPTANTSPGTAGQLTWDGDYVYICVADNDWKRANLAAW
jgi:hypothetical protein